MKRLVLLAILTAVVGIGCHHPAHLSDTYGVANEYVFTVQVINPHAGMEPGKLGGLDPKEASIILQNYLNSLQGGQGGQSGVSGQGETTSTSSMLSPAALQGALQGMQTGLQLPFLAY